MKTEDEIGGNVIERRGLDPQLSRIATQIEVMVRNESIILLGSVEYYGRKLIEKAAKRLKDVAMGHGYPGKKPGLPEAAADFNGADVIGNSGVDVDEIKKRIHAAFLQQANIGSAHVDVYANESKVTLTGTVRSWTERRDAEDVAWAMPGVTDVENKLQIEHDTYVGE